MNKLAGMEMFVRVVESGSFSAAADISRVSATMVAKHIRAIEDRLGARLLHRTTRRQQLSDVGQLYYERCKHVLADVELAEASASELQSSPRGRLRLIAPVSFGSHSLVPVLGEYMERHPEVSIELTLDNRRPSLVDDGFELGIHIGDIDEPGLVARPLQPTAGDWPPRPPTWRAMASSNIPDNCANTNVLAHRTGGGTISGDWSGPTARPATSTCRVGSPRTRAMPCASPP